MTKNEIIKKKPGIEKNELKGRKEKRRIYTKTKCSNKVKRDVSKRRYPISYRF